MNNTSYNVRISGSGTSQQIADTLEGVALKIRAGDHIESIDKYGSVEWEDFILMINMYEIDNQEEGEEVFG